MIDCIADELHVEYRVVLINPSTSKVLALPISTGHPLPRVVIRRRDRTTSQLLAALQRCYGARSFLLGELWPADDTSSRCAIAELTGSAIPETFMELPLDDIAFTDLSTEERTEILSILEGTSSSLFYRLGWIREAIDWVEAATGQTVTSERDIQQHAAGRDFALLRFKLSDGKACWLKATSARDGHEMYVSELLSNLSEGHVPHVVDVKPSWNAWVMMADPKDTPLSHLSLSGDVSLIERVGQAMAALQLATLGQTAALLDAGAFDQRVLTLKAAAEALFSKIREAMRLQRSTKVLPVSAERLSEMQRIFEDTCSLLEYEPIPSTIVHGDQNSGNIIFGPKSCHFIDWSEAYVGHPLIGLQHLLPLHLEIAMEDRSQADQRLITAYRRVFVQRCDGDAFDRAMVCMPLLGPVSALFGRGTWLTEPLSENPHHQARIRTLARYMDRGAQDPSLLKLLAS